MFDWSIPEKNGYSVFALYAKGSSEIQGLISTMIEKGYVEVGLVEAAPHNSPRNPRYGGEKTFSGVGAHLFAEACMQSYKAGYNGYVGFIAKTRLISHYEKTLGAKVVYGQRMEINEEAAKKLIERYYGL